MSLTPPAILQLVSSASIGRNRPPCTSFQRPTILVQTRLLLVIHALLTSKTWNMVMITAHACLLSTVQHTLATYERGC